VGRARRFAVEEPRCLDLHVSELEAADSDDVAIPQIDMLDAPSVDKGAIEAAVVEDLHAGGAGDHDRVAVRNGAVVEVHVGGETAADVEHLLPQRYEQRLIGALDLDVAARLAWLNGHRPTTITVVEAGHGIELLGHCIVGGAGEPVGGGDHGVIAFASHCALMLEGLQARLTAAGIRRLSAL
jgi:hypothetical protein